MNTTIARELILNKQLRSPTSPIMRSCFEHGLRIFLHCQVQYRCDSNRNILNFSFSNRRLNAKLGEVSVNNSSQNTGQIKYIVARGQKCLSDFIYMEHNRHRRHLAPTDGTLTFLHTRKQQQERVIILLFSSLFPNINAFKKRLFSCYFGFSIEPADYFQIN